MKDHNSSINFHDLFFQNNFARVYWVKFSPAININLSHEKQVESLLKNGYIHDASDKIAQGYGYKDKQELIGLNLLEIYGDNALNPTDIVFQSLMKVVSSDYNYQNILTKERSTISDEFFIVESGLGLKSGDFITDLFGSQIDMTEIIALRRKYSLQEKQYQILFQKANIGISLSSFSGEILEANNYALDLFEFSIEDLNQLDIRDIYPNMKERDEMLSIVKENGYLENYEIQLLTKSKQTKWILLSMHPILINDDQLLLSCFSDITLKKKMEQEQELMKEKLYQAQKMDSIGQLAGGIAHDFNNMISVILGNAELLLKEITKNTDEFSYIKQIHIAALRSANLTNQLLTFARKGNLNPEVIDVNRHVKSIIKMLKRLIGEDIKINWIPGENLSEIFIEPSQLEQIITNLLVNARDAIEKTGIINIRTKDMVIESPNSSKFPNYKFGKYIMIEIEDNGVGMDNETKSRIFEPYFTTKDHGKGTGLGLSIVFGIVKQNGGYIDVESKINVGTTFHIFFPVYEGKEKVKHAVPKENIPSGNNQTILLVEDEIQILELLNNFLVNINYHVIPIQDPQEALDIIKDNHLKIDLLLSDIIMPNLLGFDLKSEIDTHNLTIKTLFMTGYYDRIENYSNISLSKNEIIKKPINLILLAQKIHKILNN